MPAKAEISARRADYTAWTRSPSTSSAVASAATHSLTIEPCEGMEPLAEIVGALRKLKHDKKFLAKIFERRDKQLWPRDLLVAYLPTKRTGKPRAVGLLRRSFIFDKEKNSRALSIDFVWVLPEVRSCGCGRQLMAAGIVCGKPKDVHLQVAGSEDNKAAVALYTSLGFEWDTSAPKHTEMILSAEHALDAVTKARARRPKTVADAQLPAVHARLDVLAGGRVALRLRGRAAPDGAAVAAAETPEVPRARSARSSATVRDKAGSPEPRHAISPDTIIVSEEPRAMVGARAA